jgi:hypothetical protein
MSANSHKLTNNVQALPPVVVSLRCPHCNHVGAFHGLPSCQDVNWVEAAGTGTPGQVRPVAYAAGVRVCPNNQCRCLVQVISSNGTLVESFPPEVIDFDSTNLPAKILLSLEEAIKAHGAGCYRASALMVRRVLEELCDDKNAVGTT